MASFQRFPSPPGGPAGGRHRVFIPLPRGPELLEQRAELGLRQRLAGLLPDPAIYSTAGSSLRASGPG